MRMFECKNEDAAIHLELDKISREGVKTILLKMGILKTKESSRKRMGDDEPENSAAKSPKVQANN